MPVSPPTILKVQAEKFAKQLGHENFTRNNRWFDHFKNQYNIVYVKVSGDDLSVDSKTASEWVKSVWVECQ
jgi:spore cortex formation protein SpoVR/YcgB (stage V sporulation)